MTLITAHSGSDSTPENSLEFIEFFKDKLVDAIEVDVRCSLLTNQLIMSHDLTTGNEEVLLADAFHLLRGTQLLINCDLKEPNLEEVVQKLANHYHLWSQVRFSGLVSDSFLKEYPNHVLMNLENEGHIDLPWAEWTKETILLTATNLIKKGAKYLNLPYQCYIEELVQVARQHDVKLSLWTVNQLTELAYFENQNVYNITTRHAWEYSKIRQEVLE